MTQNPVKPSVFGKYGFGYGDFRRSPPQRDVIGQSCHSQKGAAIDGALPDPSGRELNLGALKGAPREETKAFSSVRSSAPSRLVISCLPFVRFSGPIYLSLGHHKTYD